MHRPDISWLLVNRPCYFGINCLIGRKIKCVIYLFDINTVILSCVFFCYILKLDHTDIISFLHLRKQTIIESRASIKGSYLLLCKNMWLVFWHYDYIPSEFKVLLVNLVVPVVDGFV